MKQVPAGNYPPQFRGKKVMISIPDDATYYPATRKIVREWPKLECGVVCYDEKEAKAAQVAMKAREKRLAEKAEKDSLEEQKQKEKEAQLNAGIFAAVAAAAVKNEEG